MAKAIKRVGVIFLAVAIICLMTIGVILGINGAKKQLLNNLSANVDSNVQAKDSYVEEVLLDGTNCAAQATKWTSAIIKSQANSGNQHVLVTLVYNWDALTSGNHEFGTDAAAFDNGRIMVPHGAKITLDLNGMRINRGLETGIEHGSVFLVNGGTLTIKDSKYDHNNVLDIYNSSYQGKVDFSYKINGRITGGYNISSSEYGGGIAVRNSGNLILESGMITKNQAIRGGGVEVATNSKFVMNGGLITNNKCIYNASELGGGIHVNNTCEVTITDGLIHNNMVDGESADGGGLSIQGPNCLATISGGIFSNNRATLDKYGSCGGAIAIASSQSANAKLIITGGKFEYNQAYCGGAISNWNGVVHVSNAYIADNVGAISAGINIEMLSVETIIENTIITRNIAVGAEDRADAAAGVTAYQDLIIGAGTQIYGNICENKESNVGLIGTNKIIVKENLSKDNKTTKVGVSITDNRIFTSDYSTYNGTKNPSQYFFKDGGGEISTLSGGEIIFDGTISSDKYDFVYLENNKRINYKDNNLTHAVNDFEKSLAVNDGKLIIGKILSGTLINDFISNINFDSSKLKMYNANGECVFDKGNLIVSAGAKVGTGWKLETYSVSNEKIETFYLSVLGDLTGDGNVNTLDITFMRRIAKGEVDFDSLKVEFLLAALITNKGSVINADADILWDSMGGRDLALYF